MKNDEIRALVADCRSYKHIQHWHALHLITAIETLLARQGEVRAVFDRAYIFSKSESASNAILPLYKEIRAILDPQEDDA